MSEFYADEKDWFVKPRPIEPKEPQNIDMAIKMHDECLEFLKKVKDQDHELFVNGFN